MCYYSSIKADIKDMVREFDVVFPDRELFKPAYSVSAFTFPKMPVISNDTPNQISLFQWGLVPFWVKSINHAISIRRQTLNARSETIFEKPSFRRAIRSKRCLVIADGFYEWRQIEKKKYPYYITLRSRKIFTLAGIWDTWTNPETKEILDTFSVVTTVANELMAKVHNTKKRMPLILKKENEKTWIDLGQNEEQIINIMIPYDPDDLKAYPVANKLNRLGYNTSDSTVTEPFKYPKLPELN
jgi:putative SOS response-associated peptidase YedK